MRKKQVQVLLLLILPTILLILLDYSNILNTHKWTRRRQSTTKYILYWTEMFHQADFNLGLGGDIFKGCPASNCFATNNRSLLPVDEFDAILFHGVEYNVEFHGKPEKRSSHQVYVYSNQEAPLNTPLEMGLRDFFNWTMTYRSDSDVIRPYGFFKPSSTDYRLPSIAETTNKTGKIAWLVSNCQTSSQREHLYQKLNKLIQVDVYGVCSNATCSKQDPEGCYKYLEDKYKFYLSFENSLCQDYVTEKLFNILKRNLVPIVYGNGRYDVIAPPHSLIDVSNFESVDDLAKYLWKLDGDTVEYLKYFEWKEKYVVDTSSELALCQMCEKLNQPMVEKVYSDVDVWWRQADICKTGNSLPRISFE